jgi:CHAT domain-containing protein
MHSLPGYTQCIPGDSLWKRLIYLRDSSTNTTDQQLQEMLLYRNRLEKCKSKKDSSFALLMQRIGAAYNIAGDYLQAEKYVYKSIATIAATSGNLPVYESLLIRNYYLLSFIYKTQKRTTDKLRAQDSCIEISVRSNLIDGRALSSLLNKVDDLFYIGDYHQALLYAGEGELLTRKIPPSDEQLSYLSNFLICKINSLFYLDKYDEAEILLAKNPELLTTVSSNINRSIILEHIAEIKTKKGQYTEALKYFNQSLQINKNQKNYLPLQKTFGIMGVSLYQEKLHDDVKALNCFNQALYFASKIFKQTNNEDSVQAVIASLEIYNFMANLYYRRGQFDSAIYYFQKGFEQIGIKSISENFVSKINTEFLENQGIPSLIAALVDLGDCYLNQYKKTKNTDLLNSASLQYANADRLQFIIKNQQTELKSQLFWRRYLRRLYEHVIETTNLQGDMDDAFNYFEKSRAILLNDQLSKQLSLNKNDITKLGLLNAKILDLKRSLALQGPSSEEYKETQQELFGYTGDLNNLEQQLQRRNPSYFKSIEDTTSIPLKKIRETILKDHDALLELFSGDSIVYALLITAHQAILHPIDKSDFEQSSNAYISYISDLSKINSQFDKFKENAKHLYDIIFKSLNVPGGRLIISPDGRYFPFESLVTDSDLSVTHYFLEKYAVSYSYSARYLLNNFSNQTSSTHYMSFLGVAPIEFTHFKLASLPGSDKSLENIQQFYKHSGILIASEATKSHFLQNYSSNKIIQLYTHSSDTSVSDEPVIYFSDSALYLSDLISVDKPETQLIVLSACETGNGKIYQGEGVFSFNRGFAAMGIPSTITNLWSVDNESTYKLTELFYKYLAEKMPIDLALQKAKLEFIAQSAKEQKLPFYWAAAIVVGKSDAVEANRDTLWIEIVIISILSLAGLVLLLKNSGHKTRDSGNF